MNLKSLLESDLVEVETSLHFKLTANIPFLGRKELVELHVDGFKDDDGDGDIEVRIHLEIADGDIANIGPTDIELPTSLIRGALSGTSEGLESLFAGVRQSLKSAGVMVPF